MKIAAEADLASYPAGYIPSVDTVHPVLRREYETLTTVADKRPGMFADYPILATMLRHNLAFLGRRPLMFAHNIGDMGKLVDLMNAEVVEVNEVTPIMNRGMEWQNVDGPASKEAVDVLFFAGLVVGLHEAGIHVLRDYDSLNVVSVLGYLKYLAGMAPKLDIGNPEMIRKVVHPNQGKNPANYAEAALQAPRDWSILQMDSYYKGSILPALKNLRNCFDGRLMPESVTAAINTYQPTAPIEYAGRKEVVEAYGVVYDRMWKNQS